MKFNCSSWVTPGKIVALYRRIPAPDQRFYRGSKVNLISSTWLLLTRLILLKAEKVYFVFDKTGCDRIGLEDI